MADHGIQHRSPNYDLATSQQVVKERLLQLGLSPKSLEGVTMFADSFSEPTGNEIISYLKEKRPLISPIVSFLKGEEVLAARTRIEKLLALSLLRTSFFLYAKKHFDIHFARWKDRGQ